MITYCMNILRSYSEVTPPQKSGGGALEVQQYQNMRGREQGSPRISGGRGCWRLYIYRCINVFPPQKAGGRRSAKYEGCKLGAANIGGTGRHRLTKPGRSRRLADKYVC